MGKPQFCKNSLRTSQSPISHACQSLCFRLTGRVQSAKLARVCVSGRQFVLHSFWTFQVSDRQAGILAKRISSSIEHSWFSTPTEYSAMDHATDQTGGIISSRKNRLLWMQHVIQSTETNSWQTFFFLHTSGPVPIGVFQFDCDQAQKTGGKWDLDHNRAEEKCSFLACTQAIFW